MAKKNETKEEIKEEIKIPEQEENRDEKILLAELEGKLKEATEKAAELEDRYLRTLAEYDNFKKRTAREKEDLYFSSQADVIKKLLPVFDNFDRAQMFSDGEEYRKGVDMIIQQFFQILGDMQVRQIAAEGDEFDPVFHEAVFREENESVPENTITQVLQKGYAIGDKVIRHAMVKVSG